jgi:hypothetical protein
VKFEFIFSDDHGSIAFSAVVSQAVESSDISDVGFTKLSSHTGGVVTTSEVDHISKVIQVKF